MQFSKKSFIYKFNFSYDWHHSSVPNNLCDYFWLTVKNCFTTIVCVMFTLIASFAMSVLLLVEPVRYIWGMVVYGSADIFGLLGIAIWLIAGLAYACDRYKRSREDEYDDVPKKPSVIYQLYKDYKEKYCTMIQFKD